MAQKEYTNDIPGILSWRLDQILANQKDIEDLIHQSNKESNVFELYIDISNICRYSKSTLRDAKSDLDLIANSSNTIRQQQFADSLKIFNEIQKIANSIEKSHHAYREKYIDIKIKPYPLRNPSSKNRIIKNINDFFLFIVALIGLILTPIAGVILSIAKAPIIIVGAVVGFLSLGVATLFGMAYKSRRPKKVENSTATKEEELPGLATYFEQQSRLFAPLRQALAASKSNETLGEDSTEDGTSNNPNDINPPADENFDVQLERARMQLFKEFSEFNIALGALAEFKSSQADIAAICADSRILHKDFTDAFMGIDDSGVYNHQSIAKWSADIRQKTIEIEAAINKLEKLTPRLG